MYGGGGDDTFYGSTGRDVIVGGEGNDRLYGRNGNDHLEGGNGNDLGHGGNGNDVLIGGDGDDWLNGANGIDATDGGNGADTVISVDDSLEDRVDPGIGPDVLWVDQTNGLTDLVIGDTTQDIIRQVTGFANAGADRTLNGDRIPDPQTLPGDTYERFTNRPLFSSQGPSPEDLSQGALGDCWLLAGLGSIALADQSIIKSHVTEFGDGTYGVLLGNTFYRVDNDFAVAIQGDVRLQYTAPGLENSLWVAVIEKAYTHYRTGANTFASIEGGFSFDVFPAFGISPNRVWYDLMTDITLMSDTIKFMVDTNTAPTIGFDVVGSGIPIIAAHQYILLDYTVSPFSSLVETITLRNPWGIDGPGSTPASNNDADFDDGIVTITLADLAQCEGSFEWGTV
jgi:hypothetical protein